jgi:MFS family permease
MQVADSETGAAGIASVPTKVRWVVIAGMTGSVVVAYLTRAALAPAGSSIQNELHLSNSELGDILGIWAAGYIGFQLPGGWLGDRWGRRSLLPIYALVWSFCTLVTAGAGSFAGMWWSRLVFGMAQAGLIPCLTKACMDWFPLERRGFASAAITAGMSAGAVGASGMSAFMIPLLGWRITLDLFALVGVVWAAWFWITFRDRPEQHPWVNAAEIALIRQPATRRAAENSGRTLDRVQPAPAIGQTNTARWVDGLGVYRSRAFIMLNAQAVCRAFCYAFLISWFPSYLERAHGLRLANASVMTMLPLAGVAAGAMVGGVLIDRMLSRTGSKWLSRSLVAAAALVLAGLGPLLAINAVHPAVALAALGLGAAVSGLAAPATWAATMDVGGKSATSIMAIINMSGNLGAYACPKAVGKILDAYPERWDLVLIMFATVSIAGGICWLLVNPDRAEVPST